MHLLASPTVLPLKTHHVCSHHPPKDTDLDPHRTRQDAALNPEPPAKSTALKVLAPSAP
jgi:hypothetical protein